MGNPEFAIPTIKAIRKSDNNLIAIVSNPPKPMKRGRLLYSTPVGEYAKKNDIRLLEPESLNSINFKKILKGLKPDIFILVAFKIIPKELINIPIHGAINLHASLLPKYRGAAPIQWALMNGDTETGISIFQIKQKVDTGDIISQKGVKIFDNDNMWTLGMRLCEIGAIMIVNSIKMISNKTVKYRRQNSDIATAAPKITREMTLIDWQWENVKIHNWVRGLSPIPGMSTTYDDKRLRIFKTSILEGRKTQPGVVIKADGMDLIVSTGEGFIKLIDVQIEGRKRMHVSEFLNGSSIEVGDLLGR